MMIQLQEEDPEDQEDQVIMIEQEVDQDQEIMIELEEDPEDQEDQEMMIQLQEEDQEDQVKKDILI